MGLVETGISQPCLARLLKQTLKRLIMQTPLDQEPRPGNAGLPAGSEDPGYSSVDRIFDIGVREDDVGRFSTKFQHDGLEPTRG